MTTSGGPITTSGTITFAGTLAIANGGTGQTTANAALNALLPSQTSNNGKYLTTDGTNTSWGTVSGGTSYTLQPVRVATTANITLSGTQTIDGIAVVAGDRVLVKNQSTASGNEIYVCASGSWTRATDFDTGAATLTGGVIIPVQEGTRNSTTTWVCTNTAAITVGATNVTFGRQGVRGYITYGTEPSTLPSATGNNGIAIGNGASASSGTNVVIGSSSSSTNTSASFGAVVIGRNNSGSDNPGAIRS